MSARRRAGGASGAECRSLRNAEWGVLLAQTDDRVLAFIKIGSDAGKAMAAMQTAILAELPYQKMIAHLTVAQGIGSSC